MRSSDFLGDLGHGGIVFPGVLEAIFGDCDGMRAAAPFPNQTRAGLEAEAWCGANPAHRPQGLGHGLELPPGRLAEPALGDLLKPVTERKNKEVAADPRRLPVMEPPPFMPQSLKTEQAKALDVALDRSRIHRIHD
jgi:hypothetical protein